MRTAALVVSLLALLAATSAWAARAPTRTERAAITRAVPRGPSVCYPLQIKVSTRDARYASAKYRSDRAACVRQTGNAAYLLKRRSPGVWIRAAVGTSFKCSGPLPPAVMRDLVTSCRK